ncbi:MAG: HAMP domain-containing histidine kinase [Bacteroides sp.]|nr:HAMP domain-containing histidine kinase [Bacteroides sp.]
MKAYAFPIIMFFTFLLPYPIKAQEQIELNSDSIPSSILKLKEYYNRPEQYYTLWNRLKQAIEKEQGNKTVYLCNLYKDRNSFHSRGNDVDSLKKYVPIAKELCLQVNDEHGYYRQWYLLCENLAFSYATQEDMKELDRMYDDAVQRKSEIGLAFSLNAIGDFYGSEKNYTKAQTYVEQAMALFEKLKYWNEYSTLTANYIIVLKETGEKEKAKIYFHHLDSLTNSPEIHMDTRRIAMIKDMASTVYTQPQDTTVLKHYLGELKSIYRKHPNIPRTFLYNSMQAYANLKGNLLTKLAYQDSCLNYYQHVNEMASAKVFYNNKAITLFAMGRHKDAYLTLRRYQKLSDSLRQDDTQKQLNELSARYNMNKLELDTQKMRYRARNIQLLYVCALALVLIAALIIALKFYRHKVNMNRILRKQADELQAANEKAQQAQLMKTAFIQNMNHEIRTPLNSIVGFSECLAELSMSREEMKEISTTIKKNSDNLLKIINDMISIANIDSSDTTQTQRISLDEFCSTIIHEMQEHVQPGVNLYYTPRNEDYILTANEHILRQILANLVHNALKFTKNGEVELSYRVDAGDGKLSFYVRDTGPGISSELKEKIFERFYKVDSFVPGAGLGLSLCRVLAERIGGQVYLDDSYRNGCLFVFVHPC